VITNSKIRDNIESSWGPHVGTGNVARENCVGGGAYDEGDGGILDDGLTDTERGFRAVDNYIIKPTFADPANGDFTVPASSPCAAWVNSYESSTPTAPAPVLSAVTIVTNTHMVDPLTPVKVAGTAPGAKRVSLVIRRDGKWRRIATRHTKANGTYKAKLRLGRAGRQTLKAEASGLRDSKRVKIRVKKNR
jgi:hypothetical protein